MAGLHTPSIHTVTAKVHLSQSSVLGNTFLEDTPVTPGVCDVHLVFKLTVTFLSDDLQRYLKPALVFKKSCTNLPSH